jgi:hypothetical protein
LRLYSAALILYLIRALELTFNFMIASPLLRLKVCLKTSFRTGKIIGVSKDRRVNSLFYYYAVVWDDMPTQVFDFSEVEMIRDLLVFPEHATINQMQCIFTLQKND